MTLGFAGCGGLEKLGGRGRADDLGETVGFYVKAMRWGEFQAALGLMKPLDGEALLLPEDALEHLEEVTVVSVDHELTALDDEARTAKMVSAYEYHIGSSTRLQKANQVGTWWFDEATESWFLDGPLPDFRR